ncbi:probable protein phosphatase 2C 51 [Mercurialis annua]|uniref:probable protein phosphatase 2C 51 n=1 Tax=Mercurialis annua TaxID=3986 RepID=UPI00215FB632|nr:probable protein phosphatase 2C 51 [Mercurialis annua]
MSKSKSSGMKGRIDVAVATILFDLVLIAAIPSSSSSKSKSYGGLPVSVWCMTEYDSGSAPAVYDSLECSQWKSLQNQISNNCQFAILHGRRQYQEDAIVCHLHFNIPLPGKNGFEEQKIGVVAVFDGHGGSEASEMASNLLLDYLYLHVVFQSYKKIVQHHDDDVSSSSDHQFSALQLEILKEALSRTIADIDLRFSQEAVRNNYVSGSTAVVALIYDGKILVANVGDSKALLFSEKYQSGSSTVHLSATALTYDHHPDREDERARIEAAGGSVTIWGVPRVNGVLAMSRAIGDVYLKRYGVIAEPEYTGWRLLDVNDAHLVVASDGIFESLAEEDICDLISEWKGSRNSSVCLSSTSLAECIINTAYRKGSNDNLSAIIVPLRSAEILSKT